MEWITSDDKTVSNEKSRALRAGTNGGSPPPAQSAMSKGRKGKREVIVICLIPSVAVSRANRSRSSEIQLRAKTQAEGRERLRSENSQILIRAKVQSKLEKRIC